MSNGSGSEDESFLSRWSRRKLAGDAARKEQIEAEGVAVPPEPEAVIDPATLPNIDDLTATSDFTVFLQRGVPEVLKNQALRQAWASDPAIRDFIEVAENQYNFNAPDGVPGFGALPEGTDIQALLYRVIGPPKPTAGETAATDSADVSIQNPAPTDHDPATFESAADVEPTAESIVRTAISPPNEAATVSASVKAHVVENKHHTDLPLRRRHGGALPDLDPIS